MKKIMILAAVLALAGCKEDAIDTYKGANFLQFAKAADTPTTVTFIFVPANQTEVKVPLRAIMSAAPAGVEQEWRVEVVPEQTTAAQGTHYVMPARTAFAAGQVESAPEITFRKTADMTTESWRLTLRLAPNENFELGQAEYLTNTFIVHNMVARPEWWDSAVSTSVERAYLGKYSDAKFRLIIEVLGSSIGDWASWNDSQKRSAALQFKSWLSKQDPAVYDEANNEPMQVTIKG